MPAKNEGERLMEQYLVAHGIAWEYELEASGRFPDYWLDLPSRPVCEVRLVGASFDDLPNRSGAFDALKPIADAIKHKAPQGKGLEGIAPYVVVLRVPGWVDDQFVISGAMFGQPQFRMPFDSATGTADPGQARMEFGRNGRLRADRHRHISAVAVLQVFNPTLRAVLDDRRADTLEGALETFERHQAAGTYIEDAQEVRVVCYHNVYASTPLPVEVFSGPYDEQHNIAEDGYYVPVWTGDRVGLLPD